MQHQTIPAFILHGNSIANIQQSPSVKHLAIKSLQDKQYRKGRKVKAMYLRDDVDFVLNLVHLHERVHVGAESLQVALSVSVGDDDGSRRDIALIAA